MKSSIKQSLFLLVVLASTAGCSGTYTNVGWEQSSVEPQDQLLIEPGPSVYNQTQGEMKSEYGCVVNYRRYQPISPVTSTTLIIAHGFQRKMANMAGWGEHFASHGVAVIVPEFCNSSWIQGRHDRNEWDLVQLANALGTDQRLYAGFSAGGLSAMLAARSDPLSVAYLGLDAVDNKGMANEQPLNVQLPALFIVAEPSACNAQNNMQPVIEQYPKSALLLVPRATHCHFEDPYDKRCELVCGKVLPEGFALELQHTIRVLATRWVLQQVERNK
jgi:pimeloyl-ACP methyl ester carboxylesterase